MAKMVSAALLLVAGIAGAQTPACKTIVPGEQDALVASPANHTVLYEDQDVRVLDVHSKPHTREAPHTHLMPGVMYIERQGAGTMNTPENPAGVSHPTDPNFKPRVIATKPQGVHWTENTGEIPFHAIRVEFKHPGCGVASSTPAAPGPEDAAAPGGTYRLLYEDAEVKVVDIELPAHATDPYLAHPWAGVFYMAGAAEVLPARAEAHTVSTMGDAPLHLVRFELKFATPAP